MACGKCNQCVGCDDELGNILDDIGSALGSVVGLAAPIVGTALGGPAGGAIGSALGGLIGGGGGGGGAAPKQIAQAVAPAMEAAGISPMAPKESLSRGDLEAVVRQIVSTVPSPVMDQVRGVIRQVQAEKGNVEAANRAIVQNVSSEFLPQVQAIMGALRLAQNQTDATQEHRAIVADDTRWSEQQQRQERILQKLDALESRLTGVAIVRGPAVNILGGAGVLGRSR